MRNRHVRGQATTELALGSLVFVVVLMFGIYFGEVPVMMLKVKEAANYAANHATGSRTHMFNSANINSAKTFDPFDPGQVGADTRAKFRNFDGMSDHAGSGTFTQVMTRANNMRVQCRADNRLSFQIARSGSERTGAGRNAYDDAFNYLGNRYRDRGGVACDVMATATPFRVPDSFLEIGPGNLSEEQLKARASFRLCGAGRPNGNVCDGELMVLTGDWSFDGPMNTRPNEDVETVQDNDVENDPYALFVRRLYEENGKSQGNAGRKLIEVVAGVTPGMKEYLDESIFNMSFSGDRGSKADVVVKPVVVDPVVGAKDLEYQTSGADMRSDYVKWSSDTGYAKGIPSCFLGLAGCGR